MFVCTEPALACAGCSAIFWSVEDMIDDGLGQLLKRVDAAMSSADVPTPTGLVGLVRARAKRRKRQRHLISGVLLIGALAIPFEIRRSRPQPAQPVMVAESERSIELECR